MGVAGPPGSSRALRLDPFTLPVRYAAHDSRADGEIRQVELTRERVVLRRRVSGIPMNVGVPLAEFRGVSMRLLPPEGEAPPAVAVILEHRDPALAVPLYLASDGGDALAEWKSWGRVLGLPLLVVKPDGALREPFRRMGGVALGLPSPRRRRRGALKGRRPSILLRRKVRRIGGDPGIYRGEREIIARN